MTKKIIPAQYKAGACSVAAVSLSLMSTVAFAGTAYEQCLLNAAVYGSGHKTVTEIRADCTQKLAVQTGNEKNKQEGFEHSQLQGKSSRGALADRIQGERQADNNRFTITPHKPNYLLPVSWNGNVNTKPYEANYNVDDYSSTEIKFQLSLKAPLVNGLWDGYGRLYVAYTNTSWWQAYNSNSAPFRETNHEPEVFAIFPTDYELFGMTMKAVAVGASHESNGRSGTLSRSWNRLYANFVFEKDDFYLSFKPWYRIPESEKDPLDTNTSEGDDNPDIEKYMGNGELQFGYKFDEQQVSMMLRNNLRTGDNYGAVQIDWSFPLSERFRGYVQYFNGYGESLIDYNASVNRLSVGVMLTDWL